jgi:hypothetical protein
LFYIQKSGTFDENNSLLKLGRVRLNFEPNPFSGSTFEQRLVLQDGYIRFTGSGNTTVSLWVDVDSSVIHVDVDSPEDISMVASYETWRFKNLSLRSGEQAQGSWGVNTYPQLPNLTTYADSIEFHNNGVLTSHRNEKLDLWNFQINDQGLTEYEEQLYTPMRNNEFGLWMTCPGLVPGNITSGFYINTTFNAWNLVSAKPQKSFNLAIATYQNQTQSHEDWVAGLDTVIKAMNNTQEASLTWWHNFWGRSYIIINEEAGESDPGFQVGKNYQIWRYMMGCNAKSEWPTKFNGGLFTFDPIFVRSDSPFTPDYRRWAGGTFTAQNQRLLYWPLLRSGDFDLLRAQLEFYRRITPNAVLRGRVYEDIEAAAFTEQIDNSGLPNTYEFNGVWFSDGRPRPAGFPAGDLWNTWLDSLQDTANEFADMALQADLYGGLDATPYLEFIEYQLAWFDLYYQKKQLERDPWTLTGSNGDQKLMLYPASGAETYKAAYNPVSTISGLRRVLTDLLRVGKFSVANASYYESYLARIPETMFRLQQGHLCISPAQAYARIQNTEPIQLYPVFPWGEFGLGRPNLTIALDTYFYDTETQSFHGNVGWQQDVIWLARMGQTDEAATMTEARFADSTTYRFPTFKGPNFDWSPDMNHYGSASIALQEQLMQTFVDDNIRLLGAWPERWNCRFKLHAPANTTVEAMVTAGSVQNLVVTPESRLADVIYGQA